MGSTHTYRPILRVVTIVLGGLALLVAVAAIAGATRAEAPRPVALGVVRLGVVTHPAADSLALWWDQDRFSGTEHGFCVTRWGIGQWDDPTIGDTILLVFGAARAPTVAADINHALFRCPDGDPTVHTHPLLEGVANCSPTRMDYQTMALHHEPFALVQCERTAFQFYYPADTTL